MQERKQKYKVDKKKDLQEDWNRWPQKETWL